MAATKQRSASRGRKSGRGAKKKRSSSTRSTRPKTGKGQVEKGSEPGLFGSLTAATHGYRGDLFGLFALALAVIAGLGIYGDLAGPVGRGVASGVGVAVGPLRFLFPVAIALIGILAMRGLPDADDDASKDGEAKGSKHRRADTRASEGDSHKIIAPVVVVLRRSLGVVLLVLATLGMLDLWGGRPGLAATKDELLAAGGFVGVLVDEPLSSVFSPVGAGVVLVVLALAGLVLVTGIPLARAAGASARGVKPAGTALGQAVTSLFRLDGSEHKQSDKDQQVEVVDFADEVGRSDKQRSKMSPEVSASDPSEGSTETDAGAVTVYDQDVDGSSPASHDESGQQPHAVAAAGEKTGRQLQIEFDPGKKTSTWKLPPLKLLRRAGAQQVDKRAIKEAGQTLEHALAEHGVETRLVGMTIGPTVTRYELELGPGVKVARVTSLNKDIAYAMATPDVRILAPIPGRQAIGVEVPNSRKQLVAVGDILNSPAAKAAKEPLDVAVGRDIAGKSVMVDLATMPHVLIAGATGSGKSSCINTLLTSLLMRSTPDDVRLILVDPKRVELGQYNGLPHLLTEVVTNPKKAANALGWAVREMERRYDLLSEVGVRDIGGYNAAFDRGDLVPEPGSDRTYDRLPYILLVVDELNDLMMVAARDVEASITRIAQMARAVGIHLVIATQRPSVNVITGVIKANVPARWAFAVSSLADSRVILDQSGAERLLGKGDMLLLSPSSSIPKRIQGSWVTEDEVREVVAFWKRQNTATEYDETVQDSDNDVTAGSPAIPGAVGSDDDELLRHALELVVRSQLGSTSMLQRKLRVGFARAGRLMDLLEQQGVVGPSEGSKARKVLMTVEELEGSQSGSGSAKGTQDDTPETDVDHP